MKYKPILGFSGINRQVSNFLVKDGEFSDSQNFRTQKIGVLKKAGDYEAYCAQITASMPIYSGVEHILANGTREHFVAINGSSNAGIYKNITGTWTSQSQSLTKDNNVRMAYFPPLLTTFAVNYADATRSYSAGSWSTSTNVTSAPKAKDVMAFGDRIYLFNCVVGSDAFRDRAYRSSIVDTSITWDTVNDWITFEDEIVGAGKMGEHMFVGCKSSCYLWTLNDEKIPISTQGLVGINAIASYGRLVFYGTRDGIYAHDGGNETKISEPVEDYWKAISEANIGNVSFGIDGNSLFVYIGTVTVDGISMPTTVLEYDILKNDWNKLNYGLTINSMHNFIDSTNGKSLYAGDRNGYVWRLNASGAQNTAVIPSYFESDWMYGDDPKEIKTFYELWGYGKELSALKVSYKVDDRDWESIGQLNGSRDFCKFKARGYRIKFLLEESSKNNMYEVHQLEYGYEPEYTENKDKEG